MEETMSFEFSSRRSPVAARNGMVASSQPLATMAGLQILMQGGNAADAAVATAASLNVTQPTSTGIGGDVFALFFDAKTQKISALNGSGRAPAALTIDLIKRQGLASISAHKAEISNPYHAHTVTVPGACAGWCDFIARHGTVRMRDVLAPAIKLAEEGFPVAPVTSVGWQRSAERLLSKALNGNELMINGRGPRAGEMFKNPGLARTFRTIAEGGKDAYYKGEIAKSIARVIQQAGGVMRTEDLAAHESTWVEPISTTYRGVRVWECPPNGQGLAAILALNILEGFELKGMNPLGAERMHLMIETMRVAFADTNWYVADPAFNDIPLAALTSKKYADTRRKLINPEKATIDTTHGAPTESSDTVYLCVVDGHGNAASFINSNYMGFGTGIVPEGWGFTLQNRGHNFSLDPAHPNALQPGKRPYHTIIPGLLTRESDGSLYARFGVMGGFMQPQGHMQVMIALAHDQLDPQAALDRPRICLEDATAMSRVALEEGIPVQVMAALAERGHSVRPVSGYGRSLFGRGQ